MDKYDSSDISFYELPAELRHNVREIEASLRKSVDHVQSGFLVRRQIPMLRFNSDTGEVVLNSSDLVQFLEPLVRPQAFDSAHGSPKARLPHVSFSNAAGKKIRHFIEFYFYELRELVCKANKKNFPLSSQTTIVIAGMTHWLLDHFGMQGEYAKSVATSIVIV